MNDLLDGANRSALADIVATAPTPDVAPTCVPFGDVRDRTVRCGCRRRSCGGCLAVIGLAALAVTPRDDGGDDQPAATPRCRSVRAWRGPGRRSTPRGTDDRGTDHERGRTTTVAPTTAAPTTAAAGGAASATAGPCPGSRPIRPAHRRATINGGIDGDVVDGTVTLYSLDGAWHVDATSR